MTYKTSTMIMDMEEGKRITFAMDQVVTNGEAKSYHMPIIEAVTYASFLKAEDWGFVMTPSMITPMCMCVYTDNEAPPPSAMCATTETIQ